jgi:long-chain acyl-CoA synthetase
MSFSLAAMLRAQRGRRPGHPAVICGDRTVTYAELDRRSSQLAHALQAAGVTAQDRVATLHRNGIELFEAMFGASKVNAVTLAVNWRLAAGEVAHILRNSEARVLLCGPEFIDALEPYLDELPALRTIVLTGAGETSSFTSYEGWLAGRPEVDPGVVAAPDDIAVQFYTSGTTGLPKGAMITNANLGTLVPEVCRLWEFDEDSVNLVAMPLFHIGGSGWALNTFHTGGTAVLLAEVSAAAILDAAIEHRFTNAFMVPVVLQMVIEDPRLADCDLSGLRCVVYGASPISPQLLERALDALDCRFVQAYGLTETTGAITMLSAADHELARGRGELLRSCGRPFPWVELRIVDPDTGADCPANGVGEIWTRSSQNMAGYWMNQDATAAVLDDAGWLRTGDAACMDEDGYVFVRDRINDMIITGGENVYPAEVEAALVGHPQVVETAVVGVADERWGEAVTAAVVLVDGASVTTSELIAYSRERLAHYKCPKTVHVVAELPRNAAGKILRRELRRAYQP